MEAGEYMEIEFREAQLPFLVMANEERDKILTYKYTSH